MSKKRFRNLMATFGLLVIFSILWLANGLRQADVSHAITSASLLWEPSSDLPQPAGDGVAFVLGQDLYHAGGWAGNASHPIGTVYIASLSPEQAPGNWTSIGSLPSVARLGAAVAVHNGRAYVLGGYGGSILNRVDSFNGSSWRSEQSLPRPLNFPATAVVGDHLYVAGGLPGPVAQVWSAPIDTGGLGVWQAETPLPRELTTQLAAAGNCLYVIGGKDSAGQPRREVYRAIFSGNSVTGWASVTPLPQPLALHSVVVREGMLYALGGETSGSATSGMVYAATVQPDCTLSAWTAQILPGQPRRRTAATASGRGIYLIGGQTGGGTFVRDTWYDLLPEPTPTPPAQVNIQKRATPVGPVNYDDTITYVLTYDNPWHKVQTGVVITDRVPTGTAWTGANPTPSAETGAILQWSVGDLMTDTSAAITLTVQVSPPQRTWEITRTMTADYQVQGTHRIGSWISYTIAYTLTGDPVTSGVLVTDSLPGILVPWMVTASSDHSYAVQEQDVIWRIEQVEESGYLQVRACISQSFTSTISLVDQVTLYDGYYSHTAVHQGYVEPPDPGSLVIPSCPTLRPPHPTEVLPLYPDVKIRNRAWVYSDQMGRWQPSNEVVHSWRAIRVYLPSVQRRHSGVMQK